VRVKVRVVVVVVVVVVVERVVMRERRGRPGR